MTNSVNSFSKQHTKIAKGIAALLMMYHHLFVIPERLNNNYISVLNINGFNFEHLLAVFAKICVGIFLFLSGIGLFYSFKSENSILKMHGKALKKLLSFMLNYWVIALVVFTIGVIRKFFNFDIKTVIGVITGKYSPVMEWWFVCQYVVLLLLAPLFIGLFQKNSLFKKSILLCIIMTIYGFVHFGYNNLCEGYIGKFIFEYLYYIFNKECVLIFLLGIICAKFKFFRFFVFEKRWLTVLINLIVLLTVTIIRMIYIKDPASMKIDYIIAPFFVFSISAILNYFSVPKIFLNFCAVHSTNIWLTHTFWCYYLGQKIVLLPRYSTFIFIWLFILSVVSSILINAIYSLIIKKLFKSKITIIADNII